MRHGPAALWLPLMSAITCCTIAIDRLPPAVVTEPVPYDADDPAVWFNSADPAGSLVIGTDKNPAGGLHVFDLEGVIDPARTIPLNYPNNVDVEYGLELLDHSLMDIAVVTVRGTNQIRIFRLPDMAPVDNGGLDVFENETIREPMGIALYKRGDGVVFAIAGRKSGPSGSYLWQYQLIDDGTGQLTANKVREFGLFSGLKEIEAIAVDDENGYVYYSDELYGIRKYHADPDAGGAELAVFGTEDFARDCEGIALYKITDGTGYLVISDQGRSAFNVYRREGEPGLPHAHRLVRRLYLSTRRTDGCELLNVPLNTTFTQGLFVAMSDDRTFHYYRWEDMAGDSLSVSF